MMRARPAWMAAFCLCAALLAAAGCGRSAPFRFYVLAPIATPATAPADGRPVTIGVGPVRLPGYVDRSQIVTRRAAEEIDLAEFDRWGEALADSVPRIIADNLALLLPRERIALFPWLGSRSVQYQVDRGHRALRRPSGRRRGAGRTVAHHRARSGGSSANGGST